MGWVTKGLPPVPNPLSPVCAGAHTHAHMHTLLPSEPPLPLGPPTPAEVTLLEVDPGWLEGLSDPCSWFPSVSPLALPVAPPRSRVVKGDLEHPHPHSPPHSSPLDWCLPSPPGARSWSSCTDAARRPGERGLGLSRPSEGGRGIRVWSIQLPPLQPLPPTFRGPSLYWGGG